MKIKVYIVTYKKNDVLNENLRSLWECTYKTEDIEVIVLANHPDVIIYEENLRKNLKVIINTTRMPHAWGYLSRDWNFCILDAFGNWENTERTDWLIMAQNDVTWVNLWDEWVRQNKDFDFVSQPIGDQAMLININAVKKIGFFDERFTTLHCQEADYFIRAVAALGKRCSINDDHPNSKLSYNSIGNMITKSTFSGVSVDETLHNSKNFRESYNFAKNKYGCLIFNVPIYRSCKKKRFKEVNWYPFFWINGGGGGGGYIPIKQTFLDECYSLMDKVKNLLNDQQKLFLKKLTARFYAKKN